MMGRLIVACILLLAMRPVAALEQVTLQLKWSHAFQFAGYYAAKELGYYRDAGLDVRIEEGRPGLDPVTSVVNGTADFGVGTSSLLLHRYAGQPVIVLACIFQHSPYVLVARQQNLPQSIRDIVGKRMMVEPQADELVAYLNKEGIPLSRMVNMQHSFNPQDLIDGKVDVMSAYITNELYYLNHAKFSYQVYTPLSVGIDFYGDTLFTTEQQLEKHRGRVEAFRSASLRGWKYALAHPDEIANLIFRNYSKQHSVDFYLFEAHQMMALIQPDIIGIGYVNPERWRQIADVYADMGMLPKKVGLDGFLFDPNPQRDLTPLYRALAFAVAALGAIAAFAIYVHRINRRLATSLRQLHESETLMRTLYESTSDAVMMLDENGFIDCNPATLAVFGCASKEEFLGSHPADVSPPIQLCGTDSRTLAQRHIANAMKNHREQFEWVHKRLDSGQPFHADVLLSAMHLNGRTVLQAVVRDITERKLSEEQIRHFAFYDALTGLPNRRLLRDRLGLALAGCKRHGQFGALLFLDLDNFKPLNDLHGHAVGDLLLIEVARRITGCIREIDTVARFGGDEFVVMLGDLGQSRAEAKLQALSVAEKIRSSLSEPYLLELLRGEAPLTVEHRCSSSMGVRPFNGINEDQQEILEQADAAMYQAKEMGRNAIHFYESNGASGVSADKH